MSERERYGPSGQCERCEAMWQRVIELRRQRDDARADLSALRAWVRSLGLPGLPGQGGDDER